MLFNEPKLLKSLLDTRVVALPLSVSVLFNEPKLLKYTASVCGVRALGRVSVLFNEPKLLKLRLWFAALLNERGFSALQRAEIAEMHPTRLPIVPQAPVSVLFNEPKLLKFPLL